MIRLLNKRSAFALFGLLALVAVGALANGAIKIRPAADEDHRLAVAVYPSGMGRLLVTDGVSGNTFWISKDTAFAAGSIYTQSPNDSGVTNFVGTVDPKSGLITPLAVGFTKATGMLFVPSTPSTED